MLACMYPIQYVVYTTKIINLILGLPLIKATRMVIDADNNNNVVECHALNCPPFSIEHKHVQLENP